MARGTHAELYWEGPMALAAEGQNVARASSDILTCHGVFILWVSFNFPSLPHLLSVSGYILTSL